MESKDPATESCNTPDLDDGKHKDLMTSVARSASYNIVLQLVFRVLTFAINAILLRYVTNEVLGIVNVRLTLLYSTILFVSREPFRKACLTKTEDKISWQEVVNLAWCSPVVGVLVSMVFCYVWLYSLELPSPEHISSYKIGVFCFSLAAILEMCSEPMYVVGQKLFYVRFRAILEGVSLILKCLINITLIMKYPQLGVLAFCIAQVTFSVVYTSGCYVYYGYLATNKSPGFPFTSLLQFIPQRSSAGTYINRHLASLTWSFLKQSFLKQLLTEGERYVMTLFNILSFADQGVFDIISNLGSLVARFLFAPIEDSSYFLFSQSIVRGTPATKQAKDTLQVITEALSHLIKLQSVIGLTILVFGYSYSSLLLHIYGGTLLSSGIGPYLLRWYCVYVLLMAINGITESFSFATMSQSALDSYNYKMLGITGAFLATSLLFTTYFGSAGFIMANCCNFIIRTIHSVHIIGIFYKDSSETPLHNSLIDVRMVMLYIAAFIVTSISQSWFGISDIVSSLQHLSTGIVSLLILLLGVYRYERSSVTFLITKFINPLIGKKSD